MTDPYELPPGDMEYLEANYNGKWRKVSEGGKHGLVIDSFPIPEGYSPGDAALLVLIPSGYPGTALDMFYFYPHLDLVKQTGSLIGALTTENHFGKNWQRWSRHYEWEPGRDSIVTHIEYIKNQLESDLK